MSPQYASSIVDASTRGNYVNPTCRDSTVSLDRLGELREKGLTHMVSGVAPRRKRKDSTAKKKKEHGGERCREREVTAEEVAQVDRASSA